MVWGRGHVLLMLPLSSGHPEKEIIDPLELRVAELMHHMKIESAVAEGAKNVVKHTTNGRMVMDRRILAEVSVLCVVYSWISYSTTGNQVK